MLLEDLSQRLDDVVYQGVTWSLPCIFWTDPDQTGLFDLTDWTGTLTIGDLFVLTPGAGLTIGGIAGTVDAVLTAEQTATMPAGAVHWTLELAALDGSAVLLPFRGTLTVQAP